MKTRIREIARTGTFGSTEHSQTVTDKDLQEIYESFSEMNSSPIVLGHNFSGENLRFGDVVGLELKDGILVNIVTTGEPGFDEQGFCRVINSLSLDNKIKAFLPHY